MPESGSSTRKKGSSTSGPLGEKPGDEIFAPSLMELVRVEGDVDVEGPTDTPVRGIVFDGLAFTQGDRYVVSDDYMSIQHDWAMIDQGPRAAPPAGRGRLPDRELQVLQQRRRSHPARSPLPENRRHPQRAKPPRLLGHPPARLRPGHQGRQQEQRDREQPSPPPRGDLLAFPRDHRAPKRGERDHLTTPFTTCPARRSACVACGRSSSSRKRPTTFSTCANARHASAGTRSKTRRRCSRTRGTRKSGASSTGRWSPSTCTRETTSSNTTTSPARTRYS